MHTLAIMRRRAEHRGLTTLLFTDIVSSSQIATELGDERWRRLQSRHHTEVRTQLKRHGGREVDTAGDGFFATFPSPAVGVRCAAGIVAAVREIGLEIRAGLHIGEIEFSGEKKVSGIAVSAAARVAAAAGAGQVLVTDTIAHLTAGSGLEFSSLGSRELKGVPGTWELFSLATVDDEALGSPLDPEDARLARIRSIPLEERPRVLPRVLMVAAAGLVVFVAAIVVIARDHTRTTQSTDPGPSRQTIVALEEPTGATAFPIDVPESLGLNSHFGSIVFTGRTGAPDAFAWVPYGGLAQISRENGAVASLDVSDRFGGRTCACIASAGGRLWTPIPIHPRQPGEGFYLPGVAVRGVGLEGQPSEDIVVDPKLTAESVRALVFGDGYLWVPVNDPNLVYRVDPTTSAVSVLQVPLSPDLVTFADGYLWVLDTLEGKLARVDPTTGRTGHPYPVTGNLQGLAVGGGFVWVTDASGAQIWRIPEDLGSPATSVSVGQIGYSPSGVAYDGGAIVVGFRNGTAAKINAADPSSPTAMWAVQIGSDASSIAIDDGVVWIAGHPPSLDSG